MSQVNTIKPIQMGLIENINELKGVSVKSTNYHTMLIIEKPNIRKITSYVFYLI